MPLELKLGVVAPIPCRHCERVLIKFTVSEGAHTLTCPKCGAATEVKVYTEAGALRIRTGKASKGRS